MKIVFSVVHIRNLFGKKCFVFLEKQTLNIFILRKDMVIFSGVEVDFLLIRNENIKNRGGRARPPQRRRRGGCTVALNGGEGVAVWPPLT